MNTYSSAVIIGANDIYQAAVRIDRAIESIIVNPETLHEELIGLRDALRILADQADRLTETTASVSMPDRCVTQTREAARMHLASAQRIDELLEVAR